MKTEITQNIIKRLDKIEEDIQKLHQKMDIIASQTSKMDNHVDFVNDIYSTVEKPFHFICNGASQFMNLLQNEPTENRKRHHKPIKNE